MATNARGDPFAPLEDQTLRRIAETGVVRAFPRNTVLINEGDVGDSLYVVLSGRVKVYSSNESGREFVIDFHGPGEYVGEMSLDGAPRSASVMTVEPTTCAVVNRAQFRDFLLVHPDFAMHLIERLIRRIRVTTGNLKSLALSDVYGRLVRLLNALVQDRARMHDQMQMMQHMHEMMKEGGGAHGEMQGQPHQMPGGGK